MDKPPPRARELLDGAPSSLAELPEWFMSLTTEEVDIVWVGALLSCVLLDETGGVSPQQLSRAIAAVRHQYRVALGAVVSNDPNEIVDHVIEHLTVGQTSRLLPLLRQFNPPQTIRRSLPALSRCDRLRCERENSRARPWLVTRVR